MITPATAAPRPGQAGRRSEFTICAALAVAIVFFRSFVFLFYEQVSFDSDQAILGLMAKHVSEFRAFPLFQYGLNYLLAVEAYVTAPFFWLAGVSVTSLKLPLFIANGFIEVLLIRLLMATLQLRPVVALIATVPFLLPSPITSASLMDALGGSIEPLLFVLLLWACRCRPIVFGIVFAVGFFSREFTAYGLAALLLIEAFDGSLFRWAGVRVKLVALLAVAAVWDIVETLRPLASVYAYGPGGARSPDAAVETNLNVLRFFCWHAGADRWIANLKAVATEQLPALFGTLPLPLLDANLNSAGSQGLAWTSAILLTLVAATAARLLWLCKKGQGPASMPDARFCWYLMLVGTQAAVMYAISRCDEVGLLLQRYILLALFIPVGWAGLLLAREPSRIVRAAVFATLCAWASLSAWSHVELLTEYARHPPPNVRRALADALVHRNVRYGRAAYWDSYIITFLTNERVILATDGFVRIDEYERLVDAHANQTVTVSREPCPGGIRQDEWYLCWP